jgi:hypothetical protein
MCHVKNPITGEVRYVTTSWAKWLKMYCWQDATFDEFMKYVISRLNVSDKPQPVYIAAYRTPPS